MGWDEKDWKWLLEVMVHEVPHFPFKYKSEALRPSATDT
jgi:predicted metallopeptidase